MTSKSPSSSPSEGEIVESHSEKATTSLHTIKDNNVNPQSRHRVSVSRSPSPIRSPAHSPPSHRSRTRSRSPYRDPRGAKRSRDDDHYIERPRGDARRFKIRYEDRPYNDRRTSHKPYDLDRANGPDARLSYDDRLDGSRNKRHKTRSRSPYSRSTKSTHARGGEKDWGSRNHGHGRQDQGRRGYEESRRRLSPPQSVSDRGHSPVATASSRQRAETRRDQKHNSEKAESIRDQSPADISGDVARNEIGELHGTEKPAVDEATLIEERRKRREAIKAKHRGQATPLLVQALAMDHTSAPISPKPLSDDDQPPAAGQIGLSKPVSSANIDLSAVNDRSAPATPKDTTGHDSPTTLVVLNDTDLANRNSAANGANHEDEPSAADYDPTMDMQEDRARQDNRQLDDLPSAAYDETTAAHHQDVLLPEPMVSESQARDELDMFADEDDMFADAPVVPKAQPETAKAVPVPQSKAVDMSMLDDWDDDEGYYKVILGELLDNRYHVQSNLGRGMFSGVVRATDQKSGKLAAIKIIRNNESMKKAGLKEVEILQKLALADPEDKKHVIRLERTFEYKGHLCMVFENLSINLREVLKKFGRDVGINLKAVRAYAQQMFLGLSLLRKCNVLHADLKPDNVLVNESRNLLKVCDLGSASDASENEITPYLVSRFYRAPEIILGMPYDFGIDVWSLGCTLFELYTGKILFTGRSNNQMLRAIMECRGKFSHKILRKAEFGRQHFDDLLNFRSIEKDKLTGKDVVRILNFTKPTRDLRSRLLANAKGMTEGEVKELYSFIDLLERCLNLNAEKRCTPMEALKHPFITRAKM
ncbi:MAG: hypothetical protein LQ345_007235 [Seirophora villosa]|nr:MAG: hypothetical protein LQ345_007235 [Seirophora villosa]